MSPFSKFLRGLRDSRRLKQNEFADLLGFEQSYLSSLERGAKGAPRRAFVDRLILKMKLSDAEIRELERAFSQSDRRFTLATNAPPEEYQLWSKLKNLSGKLDPVQIQLIMAVLEMPQASLCVDDPVRDQFPRTERRTSM